MFSHFIQQYRNNLKIRQVLYLFSVNLIGIPIGIVTSVVITRYLGPKGYGDYQFINNIFSFAIVIFTFGFFQAGNRALVLNNDSQKAKEYYGAELLITGGMFIIMSFFLVLYALLDTNIHEKQLDRFILYIIPFGWIYLLVPFFETLFQADNRISLLAATRFYPKIGFLITALLIYFFFMDKNFNKLGVVWLFYLATQIIVYFYVLYKLQVSFKNLRIRLIEIWNYNKSFGFNVYLGSLFALGFIQLTGILISYFGIDNSGVGFYSLALTFSMPLTFIPNTIATTHYKDFASLKQIPHKLFTITIISSIGALFALWILVNPFVRFFYGEEFSSVIRLTFLVSIGIVAHGLADFFNRYLGAQGKGVMLRNSSFIIGISILVMNLVFIPLWNETGAAIARLIGGFIYLGNMVYFYKKYIKTLE